MNAFSAARLRWLNPAVLGVFTSRQIAGFTLAWLLIVGLDHVEQLTAAPTLVFYSQGDPTDDEQCLLQRLNRARLDPAGEGQRLAAWLRNTPDGQTVIRQYGVDPDQVASALAAFPTVPPLALHPDLLLAARAHAADMAAHDLQSHTGSDGSSPQSRVAATGYNGDGCEENISLGQTSLDSIHAAYLVDWGVPNLGHRLASLNGSGCLNAVGIGLTTVPAGGSFSETEDYGCPPLLVTHGIFSSGDAPALLTGVASHDANANGQYDPGEGVAGATVTMEGGYYYAVTSASGGYALPLVNADGSPVNGPATVHLTLASGEERTAMIIVSNHTEFFASYRANVGWDVTVGGTAVTTNPTQPSIRGGGTVAKGGSLKLVVTRPAASGDLAAPLAVAYTLKGTAVAGVDYAPLPGTVTIPTGKASAKIKVVALDPTALNRPPGAPTLLLKLRGVAGAQGKATVSFAP